MANIANNDALKFIYLGAGKTPENAGITIGGSDIVFYSTENRIIVNGIEFGLTSQQKSDLTAAYEGLFAEGGIQSRVGTLESKVGSNEQISKALFQIVEDLKGKLDGGSFAGEGTGATINNINNQPYTDVVSAINALNTLVSGFTTGVASVNGQTGEVTLTGSNINTTAAAGSMFGQQSIDTAFAGVQSNIDGIQARIDDEGTLRGQQISGVQSQIGNEKTAREAAITGVQGQFNTKIGISGSQSVKDYVDNKATETLAGAQATAEAYADQKINELAGTDWTAAAGTVKNIIDELQQSGAQGLDTLVDKIRDDFNYGPQGAQSTSVKDYIDGVVANANTGAQGAAGTAETNAKAYADGKINDLDSTKDNKDTHVYVQVEQEDGKLKGVQVNSIDIASAAALTDVENQLKWVVV